MDALMAQSTLEMILKVTDKASGDLNKVKGSMGGLQEAAKGMVGALGAITAVAGAGAAVWKSTVDPVIRYNKEILDAARATRMGTEDMSRIIQAADDFGIEMSSVTRALELATKNGFAPSVESLADLADRANAMGSPTERAAMLAKILGRNWAELDPLLQAGGDAIRELTAAQLDGLVVTEEEIKKTERLRLAVDEVQDSWTALRNEIGQGIAEVMVEQMDQASEGTQRWNLAVQLLKNQGIEPTKNAIEAMFRSLETSAGIRAAFAVRDALEGIPANKKINIEVTATGSGLSLIGGYGSKYLAIGSGGHAGGYAGYVLNKPPPEGQHGLDMIVPSGYPGDSYPVMASSGERVQITPAGRTHNDNRALNIGTVVIQSGLDQQGFEKMMENFLR